MNLKTWVEIETTKGTQSIYTFRGQIETLKLNLYISGQLKEEFLKLERVYWVNDFPQMEGDDFLYMGYGFAQTRYFDFVGDLYLKVEHICCVSTLHGREALQIFSDFLDEH